MQYKKPMDYGDHRFLNFSSNNYENYVQPAQPREVPEEVIVQSGATKDDLACRIKMIMENSDRFYKNSNQVHEQMIRGLKSWKMV